MDLKNFNKYGEYLSLGVEIAAAMVVPLLIGTYVDRHYKTGPWGSLAGAFLGLLGVLNIVYKVAIKSRDNGDDATHKG